MTIENLKNTAHCGDCLQLMPVIPTASINMVLADLPYGSTMAKWDKIISAPLLWKEYKRIIKTNGCIALFAVEPFATMLRSSNLSMYRYDWIWYKNTASGFALAKKQPLRNHELVCIFYNKQPVYNPIKEERDMSESSKKRMQYDFTTMQGQNVLQGGLSKVQFIPESKELSYPKTIKRFNSVRKDRLHTTQKPVDLIEYLIKTYTNEGDIVLDNVAGSFTTGVACQNTNRNYILIEKDEKYFNLGNERLKENELRLRK